MIMDVAQDQLPTSYMTLNTSRGTHQIPSAQDADRDASPTSTHDSKPQFPPRYMQVGDESPCAQKEYSDEDNLLQTSHRQHHVQQGDAQAHEEERYFD